MYKKRTLEERILLRLKRQKSAIFLREGFKDLGGYDQVGRALLSLIRKKKLLKLGYGIYVKAKTSLLTGELIPQKPLPELALEALSKLKIKTVESNAERNYIGKQSSQIPTGRVIAVKGRICRKIGYKGVNIAYERA